MLKVNESREPAVNPTESIIEEYRERIARALEAESIKLKEGAERDSIQIVTKAKEQAEQIVRQSREEAEDIRKESARVIDETREKASQFLNGVIESNMSQAQGEFARAAEEARTKTSRLLIQFTASAEEIISETDSIIKAELERLSNSIAGAKKKVQTSDAGPNLAPELTPQRTAPEKVKPAASDAKMGDKKVDQNQAEAGGKIASLADSINELLGKEEEMVKQGAPPEPVASKSSTSKETSAASSSTEGRSTAAKESENNRVHKGKLKLEIVHGFNQQHLGGVLECLARVPGLKVISTAGYAAGNRWITAYNINLEQQVPLLKMLKALTSVEDVLEDKGNIIVKLK
jgi:hypothetical protein